LPAIFNFTECRAASRPDKRIGMTGHVLTDPHCEWPREREHWRQTVGRAQAG